MEALLLFKNRAAGCFSSGTCFPLLAIAVAIGESRNLRGDSIAPENVFAVKGMQLLRTIAALGAIDPGPTNPDLRRQ